MSRAAAILRSLNPAAVLFGPVFQREMRSAGRRRFTYWLRFLFAAGLLTVVALAFSGMRDSIGGMTGLQRFQTLQSFAPVLAIVVVWFQFATMALMAPILASPSVCDEKRAGTLPALMTTPLTSAQIAFGKLIARLVQLVILSLLSTPLLLAIRVFGGLDPEFVLAAACISISTAMLGAALGLMYSVWHRRATTAALFALFTLALFQGGPSVLQAILFFSFMDPMAGARFPEGVLSTCSPAVLGLYTAEMSGSGGPPLAQVTLRELWILNTVYNAALAGGIALLASIALRRTMVREASGARGRAESEEAPDVEAAPVEPRDDGAATDGPAAPAAGRSSEPVRRSAPASTRSRVVSDRPILWREVRLPTFGSRRVFRVAVALGAAIFLILYVWAGPYNPGLHATILIIGALAVMSQSLFLTTGGISGEREARTWDVLLCAPLTGRQVVLGKFAGVLKAQWFVPAAVLAHTIVAAGIGAVHPILILHTAAIFAGPILLFSATGVLLSLALRRSVAGAVVNLVLGISLWGGSWIAASMVAWFLDLYFESWYRHVWEACYAANPVAMIVSAEEAAVFENGFGDWRYRRLYNVAEDLRLTTGGFTLLALSVFAGYAALVGAALATAIGAFTRLSGRSS